MLPTEQARFFEIITHALGAYGKFPERRELEAWWGECRGLTLDALEVGLKSHRDDPDRGEKAPRPVDITRRLKTGNRDATRCAVSDANGHCEYPGIFSEGTMGEGPWFCPWHRLDRSGDLASKFIQASHDVPYEAARAKRSARMLEEAQHTPNVRATAELIAYRHGARPWQSKDVFHMPGMKEAA